MIEPVLEEPPAPRPQPLYQAPEPTKFDALKKTLQSGVQIVSAPQLFPTPDGVADKMVTIARLVDGDRILEPQIGTGKIADAIIRAAADVHIVGVEINRGLIEQLHKKYDGRRLPPQTELICEDFLLMTPERIGKFPRIIMNPPFTDGADWRHILHARTFLEEGGLIVALCANGPRQQAKLMHLATTWEPLPEGTFRDAGTNVRTVLLTIPA
jgi:methylase of polypeptide subunit release factors